MKRPVFGPGVSGQAQHKLTITVTVEGLKLKILDLKKRDCTKSNHVAKTKLLISCAYAEGMISHDMAQITNYLWGRRESSF